MRQFFLLSPALQLQIITMALTLGALLVIAFIAWRGRPIDTHPYCRRCGFDLYMKPTEATRCSECGALLSRKRAIRIGQRKSRPLLLTSSLGLMIFCTAISSVWICHSTNGSNWNPYKPLWWIEHRAEATDPAVRDNALAELARRIYAGQMPPAHEATLVAKAFAYQLDMNRPWVTGWGDIIQSARAAGHMDDQHWDQYELNAVQLHLEPANAVMRATDPIRFMVTHGPDRLGTVVLDDPDDFVIVLYFDQQLATGPTTCPADFESPRRGWNIDPPDINGIKASHYLVGNSDTRTGIIDPCVTPDFASDPPTGKQHTTMNLTLRATRFRASAFTTTLHGQPRPVKLTCDWEMAPSPQLVHDANTVNQVAHALSITGQKFTRKPAGRRNSPYDWLLNFTIDLQPVSIPLAYDLYAYIPSNGQMYLLASINFPQNVAAHQQRTIDVTLYNDARENDTVTIYAAPRSEIVPINTRRIFAAGLAFTPGHPTASCPYKSVRDFYFTEDTFHLTQ